MNFLCLCTAALVSLLVSASIAQTRPLGFVVEPGMDRFGADYWAGQVRDRRACRYECDNDTRCQAYAFHKISRQCWKKDAIPAPRPNHDIVSGIKGGDISLTVFFGNLNGSNDTFGVHWRDRARRMADAVAEAGMTPDVLVLTEVSGWTQIAFYQFWNRTRASDYETLQALHEEFRRTTGIDYRLAYVVGQVAQITGSGEYFQAEVVFYNPNRLRNLTADEAAHFPSAHHTSQRRGVHLRRSLPNCGTQAIRAYINARMDGPTNDEKCGYGSPTGAAWAFMLTPDGAPRRVGAYNRLSFLHEPHRAIEIYNVHLQFKEPIRGPGPNFIDQTISWLPVFANEPKGMQPTDERFYVPMMMNDFNLGPNHAQFANLQQFLAGWEFISQGPGDDLALWRATQSKFPAVYESTIARQAWLPKDVTNCDLPTYPDQSRVFGDHCAMVFRIEPKDPDSELTLHPGLADRIRDILNPPPPLRRR